MAATRVIEEERGTHTGRRHPHNGYYAGEFSPSPCSTPAHRPAPVQPGFPVRRPGRHPQTPATA